MAFDFKTATPATLTTAGFLFGATSQSASSPSIFTTAFTGTGSLVCATSPTLTTPTLGVATATSINKMAITAPATSSTLAVADGKTATFSNTITFAGTDSTTMTFPATTTTVAGLGIAQTFTQNQTISEVAGGSALTLTGATQTASNPVLNATQTWNNSGVTFTGWKLNVTDGASAAASILLDLQVGSSSVWKTDKSGFTTGGNSSGFNLGGGVAVVDPAGKVIVGGSYPIGWANGAATKGGTLDTILTRAAAATLQHGAADAASPVAQTIQVQSSNSTNNNGANWTFVGSKSAGSGTSGSIIFKAGATGAASGTTNTTVTALTITPATTNNTNVGYPSVVIGAGAALATNATDGFIYVPTCAGTPTGTPTSQTGSVPIVYDTTNNKIAVYNGGAWKQTAALT